MSNPNYKDETVDLTLQIQEDCFESVALILLVLYAYLSKHHFVFFFLSAKFLPIRVFKLQVEGINFLFYLFNRV